MTTICRQLLNVYSNTMHIGVWLPAAEYRELRWILSAPIQGGKHGANFVTPVHCTLYTVHAMTAAREQGPRCMHVNSCKQECSCFWALMRTHLTPLYALLPSFPSRSPPFPSLPLPSLSDRQYSFSQQCEEPAPICLLLPPSVLMPDPVQYSNAFFEG
jgi:hypothetical protein